MQQRERHDDHQALLGAQHVFVLAAPEDVVAAGQLDLALGDGLVDGAHGHLDVGADVDALHIHVNPGVGHGGLALDAHRGADGLDLGQLAERHLRAGGRGHDDLAQGAEVLAEIAAVAQVDRVALQALDRGGQRHAAQGDFQHVLHVAHGEAVAGDGVAVDVELDVVAAHGALGKRAERAGHAFDDRLDLRGDPLQFRQVRPGDLDADGRLDAGGQHVDAGLDRHGPGVVEAGELDGGVHRVGQFVRRAAAMGDDLAVRVLDVHRRPFLLGLEHDRGFDHVHRRGVGGGLGAADLAEDVVHLREAS